jgi:hypothetical protein
MPWDIISKIKIETPKVDNKVTILYLYYLGKTKRLKYYVDTIYYNFET